MRISDWSSDVCSSDLAGSEDAALAGEGRDGLQIDQLQQRIGRCLDPDEPGFRAHRRFQALQARHVDEAEVEARRAPAHPLEQAVGAAVEVVHGDRSEEHTSELQSLMRISYAVFCLKKKKKKKN